MVKTSVLQRMRFIYRAGESARAHVCAGPLSAQALPFHMVKIVVLQCVRFIYRARKRGGWEFRV